MKSMKPLGKSLAAAAGIVAFACSTTANALSMTFDSGGDALITHYVFSIDSANVDVTVTYSLISITSTTAKFNVSMSNDSTGTGQNRLVSFGVDTTEPDLTGASTTNSSPTAGEWDADVTENFPGFGSVMLCSFAGPNCSGGGNGGIAQGGADESFVLTLTGAFGASPSLTFNSPFPGKFQSVGVAGKSYEIDACDSTTQSTCTRIPPQEIPEPGMLMLLALSLFTLYAARRRAMR